MIKYEKEYAVSIGNGGLVYNMICSEFEGAKTLGIEVRCKLFGRDDHIIIEDISTNIQLVKELINLMADNLVTPCTAKDVVQDFIITQHEVMV